MVIFSLLVCSSLLWNGRTCLSAVELGCTAHCMGCLNSQTGSSALPYSERVPVILFWYVPGQDLSLCDLSGVNYSWELVKGKVVWLCHRAEFYWQETGWKLKVLFTFHIFCAISLLGNDQNNTCLALFPCAIYRKLITFWSKTERTQLSI